MRLSFFSFTAQFLSSFAVIADDDTPCPSIGLCVGNRGMEERTIFRLAMELWSSLDRKCRPKSETRGVAEPTCAVLENSAFTTPLQVVTQRADLQPIAQHHIDRPLHDRGTRAFFMRTRLGRRS
jgi:hypothetical protein